MHACAPEAADIVIDGKFYRFDTLSGFKRFSKLRLKGLSMINPIEAESRLIREKKEEKVDTSC
jgi:hypothetical protein